MTLRQLVWMAEGRFPEIREPQSFNNDGTLKDLCIAMGGKVIE